MPPAPKPVTEPTPAPSVAARPSAHDLKLAARRAGAAEAAARRQRIDRLGDRQIGGLCPGADG